MQLIKLITDDGLAMMNDYRWSYTNDSEGSINESNVRPLSVVLQVWEEQKQALFQLLGKKLKISKEFEYAKAISEMAIDMGKIYYEHSSKFTREEHDPNVFKFEYYNWIDNTFPAIPYDPQDKNQYCSTHPYTQRLMLRNNLTHLLENKTLAANIVNDSFEFPLSDGKIYKVQEGTRAIKVLSKIASSYGLKGFEDFRICQSLVTNQKKIKGTLTLSIHPLDYWTMSDNTCGWDSCMSWQNFGGYRGGTIEMMNSPMVVIAYIEAKDPMIIDSYEWNNKKWRQLFIVNPQTILEVKEYPYVNQKITEAVLDWLKELAETNMGWNYDYKNGECIEFSQDMEMFRETETGHTISNKISVYPEGVMYCDIGTKDYHLGYFNNSLIREGVYTSYVDYSGSWQCMMCGSIYADSSGESALVCTDCVEYIVCAHCGDIIYNSDYEEIDGDVLCQYCVQDYCSVSSYSGELHYDDYMTSFGLAYPIDKEANRDVLINKYGEETYNDYKFILDFGESIYVYEGEEDSFFEDCIKEDIREARHLKTYGEPWGRKYIYYTDFVDGGTDNIDICEDGRTEEDINNIVQGDYTRRAWITPVREA